MLEAVVGVVALQPELDDRAALHFDLRRREREALGGDANDRGGPAAIPDGAASATSSAAQRERAARGRDRGCGIRTTSPRPTLKAVDAAEQRAAVADDRVVELERRRRDRDSTTRRRPRRRDRTASAAASRPASGTACRSSRSARTRRRRAASRGSGRTDGFDVEAAHLARRCSGLTPVSPLQRVVQRRRRRR